MVTAGLGTVSQAGGAPACCFDRAPRRTDWEIVVGNSSIIRSTRSIASDEEPRGGTAPCAPTEQ